MSQKTMKFTLYSAAVYNFLWGAIAIFFPEKSFAALGMATPLYPQLWQCIGMIVGVYGVGYWLAASNPISQWRIVLVGFIGKILGPLGFIGSLINEDLPMIFGVHIIFNDLIWWVPFFLILKKVFHTYY